MNFRTQAPYQDSSLGVWSIAIYTLLKSYEIVQSTQLSQPVFRGYTELTLCLDVDCSSVKYQSIATTYKMASNENIQFFEGIMLFRIDIIF